MISGILTHFLRKNVFKVITKQLFYFFLREFDYITSDITIHFSENRVVRELNSEFRHFFRNIFADSFQNHSVLFRGRLSNKVISKINNLIFFGVEQFDPFELVLVFEISPFPIGDSHHAIFELASGLNVIHDDRCSIFLVAETGSHMV